MLQEVVQRYQESHPGLPMVMGGVSMGGMVATLTVIRKQEMWKVHHLSFSHQVHPDRLCGEASLLRYNGCCSRP